MPIEPVKETMTAMSEQRPAMLLWYNLIMIIGAFLAIPFLMMTLLQPKRRATFWHRLGRVSGKAPAAVSSSGSLPPPIWIHALSVGEVLSAEPLVDGLRHYFPDHPLVFSASTQTGFDTAVRLFAGTTRDICYYPYDLIFSVRRVVHRIDPQLVVIVETDIWPNFLFHLKRRGTPVALVNARLSPSSFRRYRRFGAFMETVLTCFDRIGAQSAIDEERFYHLGAAPGAVMVTGNVKFDQKGGGYSPEENHRLRTALGIDPQRGIILLGSTHEGEESISLAVFKRLRQQFRSLLLIVAPRDPGRAEGVAEQFRRQQMSVNQLSSLSPDEACGRCDVLVVNTIGILRYLYVLADIVFIGGSLVPAGGHNPLEPAACGKPVLFGPDMSDFLEVAGKLVENGGAVRIRNAEEMHRRICELLSDQDHRLLMGRSALHTFMDNKGAVDKTIALIRELIK